MKKIESKNFWTLSKKIFVCVLLCFCIVEGMHLKMDIEKEKNSAMNMMISDSDNTQILNIAKDFYNNYNKIEDKNFLESLKKQDSYKLHLLDKDFKPIDKKTYMDDGYDIPTLELSGLVKGVSTIYKVSLENVSEKDIEKLQDKMVGKNVYETDYVVQLAYENGEYMASPEDIQDTIYIKVKDILFLKVGDLVVVSNKEEVDKISNLHLEYYDRQSFAFGMAPSLGNPIAVNLNHERDISIKGMLRSNEFIYDPISMSDIVIENPEGQSASSQDWKWASNGIQFEENNSLYSIYVIPLISKDNVVDKDGNIVKGVIGYIMSYNVNPNCVSQIEKSVIQSKSLIYMTSFFLAILVSYVLSYMLTKRVKNINVVTRKIAANDFDVYLEEKPYDELGVLSENINIMNCQLKETIDKLNLEVENVKKLESVRKEFIANFTHEIKTPLGIIDGYIELIEDTQDEKKKKKFYKDISTEIERVNGLVLAMLNLSRLESGKVEMNIQDIDVEDMITSVIDSFALLLQKKDIKIKLNGQSEIIKADPFELEIAIKNFVSNAIKHTPLGHNIEIIYNQYQISIENEGSPISEEQMDKIWQTYVSSDREGTGLGLAICKTILDLHEFKYSVENTEKGVRFTIIMKTKNL